MDGMCPPSINVEILTPTVMVLQGRTCGRFLGHENGAFLKGLSAVIR